MNYAHAKLEFSPDPLSDTTPSWVDITTHCRSASWFSGKAKDLDDPQAGGASFVLRNDNRMFEPEFLAGVFYPNIVPLRRFRLSIVTAAGTTQQGVYYATDWGVAYPAGTGYSEVSVTCVDGFGLLSLATQQALDPISAASLADVQAFDEPFAQFTLDDMNSTKMAAATGTDGVYKNGPTLAQPPIAVGDTNTSVLFSGTATCGRAALDDSAQFSDGDRFTIEIVAVMPTSGTRFAIGGPYNTAQSDHIFGLSISSAGIATGFILVSGSENSTGDNSVSAGTHHFAVVWDGNALIFYTDGVEKNRLACGGSLMVGDANEFLWVGGSTHAAESSSGAATFSHAAFYEQVLTPARIKAHADAALNRGYPAESAGDRINALATNPLWSVAGITTSDLTVAPRMQTGQATLDEITTTVQAETPQALFYFNDAGNPAYQGWNQPSGVIQAVFGDAPGEVGYTAVSLAYDDELYNVATATRDGGATQTATDATSSSAYGARSIDRSGLILNTDTDAGAVADEVLARFKDPAFRVESLTLNGANPAALTHILTREIGDMIEVRRRGMSGLPIDVITTILGKQKSIDPNGNLICTWNLARGFNAADGDWHLGITGYSELGNTTVLA